MWLTATTNYLVQNANEVCFSMAMIVSFLFYKQYKRYEQEAEREELLDEFLAERPRKALQ